jgi:hypothetical protein
MSCIKIADEPVSQYRNHHQSAIARGLSDRGISPAPLHARRNNPARSNARNARAITLAPPAQAFVLVSPYDSGSFVIPARICTSPAHCLSLSR